MNTEFGPSLSSSPKSAADKVTAADERRKHMNGFLDVTRAVGASCLGTSTPEVFDWETKLPEFRKPYDWAQDDFYANDQSSEQLDSPVS